MPTPRMGTAANIVHGKIYVIGGLYNDGDTTKSSILNEVYDTATDAWTTKTPKPVDAYSASAVVDNKIYIIGYSNQMYDPETDKWSIKTQKPSAYPNGAKIVAIAAAATTGMWAPKRIYVIGGRVDYFAAGTDINQVYNPENDSWTFGTSMPTARYALAIAVVNDKLYALGGANDFNSIQYRVNEQYIPFGYGTIPTTEPEPFPTTLVIIAIGISLVFLSISLLVYFRKRKRNN